MKSSADEFVEDKTWTKSPGIVKDAAIHSKEELVQVLGSSPGPAHSWEKYDARNCMKEESSY